MGQGKAEEKKKGGIISDQTMFFRVMYICPFRFIAGTCFLIQKHPAVDIRTHSHSDLRRMDVWYAKNAIEMG